jgi:hypothetical protein
MNVDTNLALGFLDGLDSCGRHDLVAIHPDSGRVECVTVLFPNEREKARRWIDARQGKANLYASVNRARDDVSRDKRLSGEDIGLIRAIPVDMDVPKLKGGEPTGQHFGTLRAKLLDEVVSKIAADTICPPSLMVDSGGGIQLYWELRPAIPATAENIESVKGIGRTINNRLKAEFPDFDVDNVTDLPRIMRLPGTRNIPDAGKRAQGRSPAPATVLLEHCSPNTYALDHLSRLAPPSHKARSSSSSNEALPKIDMETVRSVDDYDDLPAELRARFESAFTKLPSLRNLWNGHKVSWQVDTTRSGYSFALAWALKRDGRFTPTEFGQLLYIWDFGYGPDKADARRIGRDWSRAEPPIENALGYEAVTIGPRPNSRDHSAQQTKLEWEPTDLWVDDADPPDLAEGVLPAALERWVKDEAERKGVDLGVMAVPAVVVCAAAIPAQFRLQVKQEDTGHKTCAVLWGAIVGGPGSRKSPVLAAAKAPIQSVEENWAKRNRRAQEEYEKQLAAYKRSLKEGRDEPEPLPPRKLRKIVMDTTVESLGVVLAANPAGLLCFRDELAQWAGNMDAYRAGKPVSRDQGFWLEAKDGDPYVVDRIARGTLPIEVNAVHVLGGIQPDVIRRVAPEWGSNGLMQRFLIVIAKVARTAIDRKPNTEAVSTIRTAIGLLMDLERSPFLAVYRFSPEADEWRRKILAFASGLMSQQDTPLPLRGWLEKLEGEWARLCLVFHFIEWATGSHVELFPPELISVETALRAARFLIEFQYPHQKAFYRSVAGLGGEAESDARWIAGHILSHCLTEIDERTIDRACPRLRGPTKRAARLEATRILEAAGWLRPLGRHRSEGHVNHWGINPAVHDGRFATKAAAEAARREEAQEGIERAAEVRRALRSA